MRIALAVAVIVVSGLVVGLSWIAAQETVGIDIRDFAFEPRILSVRAGTPVRWVNRDDGQGSLDELYDLDKDPYELRNLSRSSALAPVREKLRKELRKLTTEALGL